MSKLLLLASGLLVAFVVVVGAVAISMRRVGSETSASSAATALVASEDRRIKAAETMINRAPREARGYNQLCAAFMKKARETGDFGLNAHAEAALKRSLKVDPHIESSNYDALRMQASLHLTYHRFADALQTGQQMQKLRPDDHYLYGVMTDALVELGRYKEAVEAADKMVELRPDATSYARISYLRSLYGYRQPAIEAMQMAVKASSPQDAEGHAWYRVHLGNEFFSSGKLKEADREFEIALQVFPDYYEALAAKARLSIRRGDFDQAIEYYRRAQEQVPLPDTVSTLGDLYARQGRNDEAKKQYELFDAVERSGGGTYSRQMALFLADHDMRLNEALEIAQRERQSREDIFTCDALAWCLFKNNKLAEAKNAITEALRLGTQNARIYYHAGRIYEALGERGQAKKYLDLALTTDPIFDVLQAEIAKTALKGIANKN